MIWVNTADNTHFTVFTLPFGPEIKIEIYDATGLFDTEESWKFRLRVINGLEFKDLNNRFQNLKQAKEESLKIFTSLAKKEISRFWKQF